MITTMLLAATAIFFYMNLVFVLALIRQDNSIVDIAWGPGFVVVAGLTFFTGGQTGPLPLLILALVTVWGGRLGLHLWLRNRGRGEDFRYRNWRQTWGKWFILRSYLQIYLLQGLMMFIISLPVQLVNTTGGRGVFGAVAAAGVGVWLVGFLFEAVGDFQLLRFMRHPAHPGRVMRYGVWRWTRHPNYFGEATLWWGIALVALGCPYGYLGLLSPLTIDFLLLYVSGIPMLEAKYRDHPEYQQYCRTTSAFLPWPPRPWKDGMK